MKNKKIIIIAVVVIVIIAIVGGIMGAKAASEKRTQELYANINEQIEKTENLETNYFAGEYDLSAINKAKEFAQKTISNSDKDNYKSAFENLQKENDKLNSFIKEKEADIYNVETGEDESYPFMIKEDDFNREMLDNCLDNIVRQSSKYPTQIQFQTGNTTDSPNTAIFFFNDYVIGCTYDLSQVDTVGIQVKTENETKTALVNTRISFVGTKGFLYNGSTKFLEENCGYLCRNKDNTMILLIKSFEGEDYYIEYKPW